MEIDVGLTHISGHSDRLQLSPLCAESDSTGLTTFERNHELSQRDQIKKAATSVLLMTA